ncbi:MAG TPA: TlpA disulfide reductase family protein [Segetibacter sp.]|jgi:thiol-disulfide isomerase/thioredoxin
MRSTLRIPTASPQSTSIHFNCGITIKLWTIVSCVALLCAFASCRSYRTAEVKVKPVYFTADPQIFRDTLYPPGNVWYRTLQGLRGNSIETVELKEADITNALIKKPTFFRQGVNTVLLYPEDTVHVSGEHNSGDYSFFLLSGTSERKKEMALFETFQKIKKPQPAITRLTTYSVEDLLEEEKKLKEAIEKAESASKAILDSLFKLEDVSVTFKALTNDYVRNMYDSRILSLYKVYKDSLIAYGIYNKKLRQLIPRFNAITKKQELNANLQQYLNDLEEELFPNNLMWSFDDEGFRSCFDSIENHFTNHSRDYLLSRLVYRAYAKGLKVPLVYVKKYRRYCKDKDYRKIVSNTKKERKRNNADTKGIQSILLASDGKSEFRLEKVLEQNKGKIILIDVWASWCSPCIQEMPYLAQLRKRYPEDKVVFIPISIDKKVASWRQTMSRMSIQKNNNYLLLNASRTSFLKQFNINVIPRYLLFGKDGKIINDNTPAPSEPYLMTILDKLILE